MRKVRITGEISPHNVVKERYGGKGRTLGSYLSEALDGANVSLDDPFGGEHTVSLTPFTEVNPSQFLMIRFAVSLQDGSFDPDNDAVVLKEFELPDGTPLPGLDETA
jgi:hypothetical protein